MNTIEIRPLFRESVQGRNVSNIIDGKKVGTTKAGSGKFVFQIQDDGRNKRLAIDLSYQVPNPWYGKKASLPSNWYNVSGIDEQETLSKQKQLEIKYNKESGYLDNSSFDPFDVDVTQLKRKPRTYLQSIMHIFEDGKNVLHLDNLHDEIIYEAVKSSKFFAMDYTEAQRRSNEVRYYVSHLEQEAEQKANRNRIKLQTFGNLRDLIEKFPAQLSNVAVVLKLVKGKVAHEVIENTLSDYIESTNNQIYSGQTREARCTEFNKIFKIATSKDKVKKERFATMVLGQELVNSRVIIEQVGQYKWVSKRATSLETVARSYESYISFLLDPNNHELIEEMKEEMKTTV